MKYCAAYYSDIGIQKETNQDSLLLVQRGQTQDDEAVLAVICDGVGGLKMGERSSAAVVTAFRDWFYERVLKLYVQETPETELFDDWDNLIQSLHILSLIHISEPTSLGMSSYAVICLKK